MPGNKSERADNFLDELRSDEVLEQYCNHICIRTGQTNMPRAPPGAYGFNGTQ